MGSLADAVHQILEQSARIVASRVRLGTRSDAVMERSDDVAAADGRCLKVADAADAAVVGALAGSGEGDAVGKITRQQSKFNVFRAATQPLTKSERVADV